MTWREAFHQSPLARRLIFWTILFSSCVTLVLTGLQLYRDYRHDLSQIEQNFAEIEAVHLATLTNSLWATDKERLQLQLDGMLQLQDMHYFEVREGGLIWARAGRNASRNVIRREIPLRYWHNGREQVLGTLVAVATLDHVYGRLLGEALMLLVSNGVKTFLVAVFMLLLIYYQVTRHLLAISRFVHQFSLVEPPPPLTLDRALREDELRTTVMGLNQMHARLTESIQKLAESEERFRFTFEQAAVGIAHVGPGGRWLRVNQKLCDILGYTREELVTKSFQDITHPEDLDADLAQVRQVLANELQTCSMEKRYFRKDGHIVWTNLTLSLVRKATGAPDYFIAVVEDIDARRRAESRVRRNETLLSESQRIAHLGSFEWDAVSGDLRWSDELYRIYGVTPQDFTLTFDTFIARVHPDDRGRVQSMVARVLKDGEPINYEERVLRPDGEVRLLATEVTPVKHDDGRVLRLIGACYDITERKQAETEREKLLNELTVRNVEMEAFIYTISHDLKSPLITIGGFSALLGKDIARDDSAAVADSLTEIKKAVELMQTHIQDLLLLSSTGRVSAEQTDVPLAALLEEVIGQFGRRIAGENAQLVIAPDLPAIRMDRKGFVRVYTNLIDNALKYRRPDIAPRIEFGWRREGVELRLFVRDNGQGIKKEYQQRIFGLFQRADSKTEGTGVGLAISKRVIEVHGGRMWVESEPGKGSTFWIGLPETTMVNRWE